MPSADARVSRWLPLTVVVLAQTVIVANLTTVDISIGALVTSFHTTTSAVQSAMVACSLVTAALMILSGRAGALYGSLAMFRGGITLLALAMAGVALSSSPAALIVAEALAGAATAALAPTLVALIAASYRGRQETLAIGALGVAGGAITLLLAGVLGTAVGWRVPFWVLVALALIVLAASVRLAPAPKRAGVAIDWLGVLLSASGILLLAVGVNGISAWGLLSAKPTAPVELFGLSPAIPLILGGLVLLWLFLAVQRREARAGRQPLLAPEVVSAPGAPRAGAGLLVTVALGGGCWFLLPLYMQVVQGYDGRQTAIRMLPYVVAVTASALLVTRLVGRVRVAVIARVCLLLMAGALVLLGIAIDNDWGAGAAILGLIVLGFGQGAVLTIVSTILIGASRTELANEAGALRATLQNLGSAIGTAVAGALLIGLLGVQVTHDVASSDLPAQMKSSARLENVAFVSNDQLENAAREAGLSDADVQEAVTINTEARLAALQQAFFALAVLAAVGALLAGGLRGPQDPTGGQDPGDLRGPAARTGTADQY